MGAAKCPHFMLLIGTDDQNRSRFGGAQENESRLAVRGIVMGGVRRIEVARAFELAGASQAAPLMANGRERDPLGLGSVPNVLALANRNGALLAATLIFLSGTRR
jgi:hypothetical protein